MCMWAGTFPRGVLEPANCWSCGRAWVPLQSYSLFLPSLHSLALLLLQILAPSPSLNKFIAFQAQVPGVVGSAERSAATSSRTHWGMKRSSWREENEVLA
jgi:hypothetical protein